MEVNCIYYDCGKCNILKKLYCKTEKCSFYKEDETKVMKDYNEKCTELNNTSNKKNYENKRAKTVNTKMTDKERKEYSDFLSKKYKINKDNKVKYINYGELVFSDEEIKALKNGKLKIH